MDLGLELEKHRLCMEADLLFLQIASEDGSAYRRNERISGWSQLTGPEKTLEPAVPKRVLSRYFGGHSHQQHCVDPPVIALARLQHQRPERRTRHDFLSG